MGDVEHLLDGFRRFRRVYYRDRPDLFRDTLSQGQTPRCAVVACSDSRVAPEIVLQTRPGDIFTVRNIAALVPPYEEGGLYHGTSAALEFAVKGLGVEHLIVIGHAHCGGVAAMVRKQDGGEAGGRFVAAWTSLLLKARDRALAVDPGLDGDALLRASERQAVRLSLENITTFPFLHRAVEEGRVQLHGWYLDIFEGALERWNPETAAFDLVDTGGP